MGFLSDLLHDEIDASEELLAQADAIVQDVWVNQMPRIVKALEGKGDGSHIGSHITEAMQIVTGLIAERLAELTTGAVQEGGRLGELRGSAD